MRIESDGEQFTLHLNKREAHLVARAVEEMDAYDVKDPGAGTITRMRNSETVGRLKDKVGSLLPRPNDKIILRGG